MHIGIRTAAEADRLRRGEYRSVEGREIAFSDVPVYRLIDDQPTVNLAFAMQVVEGWNPNVADGSWAAPGAMVVGELIADDHQSIETAPLRVLLWYDIPESEHGDFESWYADEHVHFLMREPRWWRCRRVRLPEPCGGIAPAWSHVAIHELAGREALSSPMLAEARVAKGQVALSERPWFSTKVTQLYELATGQ